MDDIDARRRRRNYVLVAAAVLTIVGLSALCATKWLDKDRASVIAAFLSVLATAAAWEATGRASDTAEKARQTANIVAAIEKDRWRHDFTPQIDITIHPLGCHQAHMHVTFSGPAMHPEVAAVRLSIIDDGRARRPGGPYGLTQEQIDAQIWGPYRFELTNEGVSEDGRTVPSFTLKLGQAREFSLMNTRPPGDYPQGSWAALMHDLPLRIRVECEVAGEAEAWAYIREVEDPLTLAAQNATTPPATPST